MSAQGLEVIDHTVQLTHEWINELAARLDWSSKRSALRLLRLTLHRVRDHLLPNELAQFSAQLPLLVRGMFFEGWVPKHTPIKDRNAEEFKNAIDSQMREAEEYRGPEDIRCVFDLLNARLTKGEIEDVRANLPMAIRALWSAP
ncbi:DUF2267 domain-containing protein [uncultured Roseobacter sp.]|uniref:DUF2267 domain-containing protein n=1 Tax=uncultured Roseobacter sp. TaxID=114847 RepID=UPI0026143BEB|nr:DUF2267 domain-containing protein [uncultured Roseobacter sp.]